MGDKSLFGYDVQVHNHAEDVAPPHTSHDSGTTLCANIVDAKTGKLEVAPCFLPTFVAGPYWVLEYNEQEGFALISGGPPRSSQTGHAPQVEESMVLDSGSSPGSSSVMKLSCRKFEISQR